MKYLPERTAKRIDEMKMEVISEPINDIIALNSADGCNIPCALTVYSIILVK